MAANGKNLEFALRIKADLAQASKEVTAFAADMGKVKTEADTAAVGLDRAAEAAKRLAQQQQIGNGLAQQKAITSEVVRRAQIEADANARNLAAARELAAENYRIANKRADSIAAFSAATPEQLRTPQDRSSALGNAQVRQRDADLRMLEINRRADALEARLTTTRRGLAVATDRYTAAVRTNTISAGQQANAMRQLPAQITDITTSLASGQKPWLVFLQQGGQLKDSFGGVGPALRAVVGAISPMVVGLGLAAAAIGAIAVTAYQGYQQIQQFERSLISTGNASGSTAGQLGQIRNEVAAATGAYGDAQAAVTALAASGRIGADVLDDAASAALNLSELTGRSIEDTTDQIIRLAKAPTATLAELNGQYNFLTLSVYDHVRSLEAQGNQTAAAQVAIEAFARVHEQRVEEARAKAGALERKWLDVKASILGAIQSARDFGREDIEFRLAKQTEATKTATSNFLAERNNGGDPLGAARALMLAQKERLEGLIRESNAAKKLAAVQAEAQRVQRDGVAASGEINQILDDGVSKADQLGNATDKLRAKFLALRAAAQAEGKPSDLLAGVNFGADGSVSGGAFDRALASLRDKFKGPKGAKPKKTTGERADDAAQRELLNLKEQITLLGSLEAGEKRAAEAVRIRFEIEQGAFKNASPALKQQLQDNAQLLDTERQKVEMAKGLADVRSRTLQLQGRGDEVQLEKTRVQLEALRKKLVETGDAAGAADITKLMNLEKTNVELQRAERAFSAFNSRLSNEEQRVNIARESGLISGVDAQRRLLALRQEEIAQIQQLIPQLELAAKEMGDIANQETLAKIDQLKTKLFDLQTQGTLLQTTLGNALQTGIESSLNSLIEGTATAKEAALSLIRDVASGLARLAVQQLASMAQAKLMSLLFKGKNQSADVGAGADKLQVAAVATGLAGGVVQLGAKSLSSAAQELASAATLMIVANSMGGFADGGFTGPGGKYEPAGIVHRGEYVQPQARMREPGALAFMRDFHAQGMQAIGKWRGYAQGGFVSPAAPSLLPAPRYSFAEGGLVGGGAAPQVHMRNINLIDGHGLVQDYLEDSSSDRTFINKIGRNAGAINAQLGK